ncbi:hypothetical protein MPLB_1870062 [Mesorhizobium sp. ORS 3324]|nr:hypothetical protein MPLB_1870062 [Mesorhizobium sp. ORS 3324]
MRRATASQERPRINWRRKSFRFDDATTTKLTYWEPLYLSTGGDSAKRSFKSPSSKWRRRRARAWLKCRRPQGTKNRLSPQSLDWHSVPNNFTSSECKRLSESPQPDRLIVVVTLDIAGLAPATVEH